MDKKIQIGLAIFIICIIVFGWWGFLSLLIILPMIGWEDRHKGPLFIPTDGISDYEAGNELHLRFPKSSRLMQDILVDLAKERISNDKLSAEVENMLHLLKGERYGEDGDSDQELLIGFLNQFSANFPNWQNEYRLIHKTMMSL